MADGGTGGWRRGTCLKYRGEEKSRGRKGWGKGRVIGWIATRT
jgi:hypothetical protein